MKREKLELEAQYHKERLAEELISPIKPSHPENNIAKMIETFLLCPEIIPILQEKLLPSLD